MRESVSSRAAGLQPVFANALAASGLNTIRERLDVVLVIVGEFAALDGLKSCANIAAQSFQTEPGGFNLDLTAR